MPEFLTGLTLPLICAPMFLVSGPDLVIAACRAGIVGGLPAGTHRTNAEFRAVLRQVAQALEAPRAPDAPKPGPLAVNLSFKVRGRLGHERFEDDLAACRDFAVPIVITTSGDPAPLVPQVHAWGGLVFHDVTTVRHAEKAAEAGVDGLILVCGGGGGHSGLINPLAFVPRVREFFDGMVVVAGALGTGEAILAAQVLGADLCYMGTRFIASAESMAPQAYKEMLVRARVPDLVYTPAFTHGVPASFLKPSMRLHGIDPDGLALRAEPPDAAAWRDIWSAGQSVEAINGVLPVSEIVDGLRRGYEAARARAAPAGLAGLAT